MKVILRRCPFALSVVIVVAVAAGFAFAQQTWQRTYGGAGSDNGCSVQQTSDTGYTVAGITNSYGDSSQVYLIKTNASGDTIWTRTYGGTSPDAGYSVEQTQDGGYIVAGLTNSFGNDGQVYLVKTNASGDTLWTRNYGGASNDVGLSVQQTQDGGYIVAGYTWSFGNLSQVYLIKTNAVGDTLWTRNYGGASNDYGYSVQQTSDMGYIVAGYTESFGNGGQVYLVKTNASGDTLWTMLYGGTSLDEGRSVQQTLDTGYIVAGSTESFGNGGQVYLIKTNAVGDTLWTRNYGGAGYEWGRSVQQTSDGGYIVVGLTYSFGNQSQVYLLKTNASGDTLWTRSYGGTSLDEGRSVQQTSDGGYIVAGWTKSFGADDYDFYLIKTDANGTIGVEEENQISNIKYQKCRIMPNPFVGFAVVPGHEKESFALFDISGRQVGVFRGDRIGVGLAAGVYFIQSQTGLSSPQRIVKIR